MTAPICKTTCGEGGGSPGAGNASAAKITDGFVAQSIPGPNILTVVLLPVEEIQVGSALTADEAGNQIIVNRPGVYLVEHSMQWQGTVQASVEGSSVILINGTAVDFGAEQFELGESLSYSFSMLLELAAGDRIQLAVNHNGTVPISILARLWATLVA